MSNNNCDKAIAQVFKMQDEGKSEQEIIDWVEKQSNADDIFDAFQRMIQPFSSKKP